MYTSTPAPALIAQEHSRLKGCSSAVGRFMPYAICAASFGVHKKRRGRNMEGFAF